MTFIKVLIGTFTALGACGVVAGVANKVASKKAEAGKNSTPAEVVEAAAALPCEAVAVVGGVSGIAVIAVAVLAPVSIPLIICTKVGGRAFGAVSKALLVSVASIAAYESTYNKLKA